MKNVKILKLTNLTPLHIGTGTENYDFSGSTLHSDTLSSAMAAIRAKKGKVNDVEEFLQSFSISSAFPFKDDTLFLPLPKGRLSVTVREKKESDSRKQLKKLQYAQTQIWQRIVMGEVVEVDEKQIRGAFLMNEAVDVDFHISRWQVVESVSVSRTDGAQKSDPLFFEWTFFSKGCGLFVLVDAEDTVFEEVKSLMTALGETGIGTDKSVGGGYFNVQEDVLAIDTPNDANAIMLLSLFIPLKEEMDSIELDKSSYSLVRRGGFMAGSSVNSFNHLRKKSVYMFDVGSVFPKNGEFCGNIVDLKPEWNDAAMHSVFRSGRALTIPVKMTF